MKAEAEQQTDLAVARRLAGVARDVLDGTAGGVVPAAMIAVAAQARAAIPETAQLLRDALDLTPSASETAPIPWSWSDMTISADGRVQAYFREDEYRPFDDDVEPHATLHLLADRRFCHDRVAARRGVIATNVQPRWALACLRRSRTSAGPARRDLRQDHAG